MSEEIEIRSPVDDDFIMSDIGQAVPGIYTLDRGLTKLSATSKETDSLTLFQAGLALHYRSKDGSRRVYP